MKWLQKSLRRKKEKEVSNNKVSTCISILICSTLIICIGYSYTKEVVNIPLEEGNIYHVYAAGTMYHEGNEYELTDDTEIYLIRRLIAAKPNGKRLPFGSWQFNKMKRKESNIHITCYDEEKKEKLEVISDGRHIYMHPHEEGYYTAYIGSEVNLFHCLAKAIEEETIHEYVEKNFSQTP